MGEEVDADPSRRWMASALAGFFYILTGFTGALIAMLLSALPQVLIATLAGLALLGTLSGSLHRALAEPQHRDSAVIAFLITASGVSMLGIGSAFWGLVGGMLTYLVLSPRSRA